MLASITTQTQALSISSSNNKKNVRDVSFSSYLNSEDKAFVRGLADLRKTRADGEIAVFGADRYFNGDMDHDPQLHSPRLANPVYEHNGGDSRSNMLVHASPKIRPGTPSVSSESSWNSQSALLQSNLKNSLRGKKSKVQGKSFLANLSCKCSCSNKESVDVNKDDVTEIGIRRTNSPDSTVITVFPGKATVDGPKMSPEIEQKLHAGPWSRSSDMGFSKENYFQFPVPSSISGNLPVVEEPKPRKSIEVFGSTVEERRNEKSLHLDRKPTMLSWSKTPSGQVTSYSVASGTDCNDNESDASSDLFEIESITGRVNPLFTRQGSDATSGCATPITRYAPSEASIEWSVVTASAADFSVASDFEAPAMNIRSKNACKENSKRRPSILMGCKNEKSVRVAGKSCRTSFETKPNIETRTHRTSDSYTIRFPVEAKLTGSDSYRKTQRVSLGSQSFSRSRSPRNSDLLHIH